MDTGYNYAYSPQGPPAGAPRTSKLIRSDVVSDVPTAVFILEIGQSQSNGPPSVILGGTNGAPNPNTESAFWDFYHSTWVGLVGLVGRFSDALPPFWKIPGNWESLGSNYTAESRMFVWWNDDSKKEEKRNWYSKRLQKFNVSLQSGRQISVVVSDVFEYFISKK